MHRTRDYRRKMRAKQIKRKKNICKNTLHTYGLYPYYKHDGQYSKGKIHCSCRMCRSSDYNGRHILTIPEVSSILKMNEELNDIA